MSDTYDADILLWSEHQSRLLQRLAAGERVNHQVDWPHLIEEIEAVGRSDLRAVQSLLLQALVHDLKAEAWPLSPDVLTWRADARLYRAQARRAIAPSMRHRINVAELYADALYALPETLDGLPPLPVPDVCPVTLEELLGG